MNIWKTILVASALFYTSACCIQAQMPQGIFGSAPAPDSSASNATAQIASDPAQPFQDQGKKLMVEMKYAESKEAFRTALRLSPMNPQLWALYDEAAIGEYIELKRKEKINPVIERDISPVFSIDRIDSYNELGTLYIVGSLRNVSKEIRQKIVLVARLLDENKRELRRETGILRNTERGLSPNESSLFEIPFKNPPPGGKSFRVEVETYE